jgi:hypothetical protein
MREIGFVLDFFIIVGADRKSIRKVLNASLCAITLIFQIFCSKSCASKG